MCGWQGAGSCISGLLAHPGSEDVQPWSDLAYAEPIRCLIWDVVGVYVKGRRLTLDQLRVYAEHILKSQPFEAAPRAPALSYIFFFFYYTFSKANSYMYFLGSKTDFSNNSNPFVLEFWPLDYSTALSVKRMGGKRGGRKEVERTSFL